MRKLTVLLALLIFSVIAVACTGDGKKSDVEQRLDVFADAEIVSPTPHPVNFPLRTALVEYTLRQDLLNHPWYVYILGDNGNVIGYYVAQTAPVNSCTFLSSSQLVHSTRNGKVVLDAPSLDGIYYGEASCDSWFWFDGATDALIQIRGVKFFTSDVPLSLEAEPITVAVQ